MELDRIVKLECCVTDFSTHTKDGALRYLAGLMKRAESLRQVEEDVLYQALKSREDKGSTGFSDGIAIPHCQLKHIDDFVIGIAIAKKGISFDALDKKKSRIFVVIIGPEGKPNQHIQLLASVSTILSKPVVRENLVRARTKIGIYEEFLRNAPLDLAKGAGGKHKLLVLTLADEKLLEDITEVFVTYGIHEATVLESRHMGNILSTVPLFLNFFDFLGDKQPFTKTILARVHEHRVGAIVKGLEDLVGDLAYYSGLSVMVIDLAFSKGQL